MVSKKERGKLTRQSKPSDQRAQGYSPVEQKLQLSGQPQQADVPPSLQNELEAQMALHWSAGGQLQGEKGRNEQELHDHEIDEAS